MLIAVKDSIPELFRFVHSVYAQTSSLFCRDQVVESSEGVQQGNPLGPLLFCLTIHPMVEKLRSELRAFYLLMMAPLVVTWRMFYVTFIW